MRAAGSVLEVMQPPEGGVPEHVLQLAPGLARLGWRVEVATTPTSIVRPALEAAGITVHGLPFDRGPRGYAQAARRLRALDRRGGFDIVHAHSSKAGALARAVLPRARRLVYTPHCFAYLAGFGAAQRGIYRLVEQALVPRTGTLIVVCEWERRQADRLRGIRRRIAVVDNGVAPCPDLEADPELRSFAGSEPLAAFIGRLEPQKDPVALVRAAGRLAERGEFAGRVAVIGNGSLKAAVEAEISASGLDGRVRWFPFRHPPARYLRAADVFVLPSRWEAMPLSVLEAMACGVPSVATAVGAVPDMVEDGVTGRLVPPADEAALAGALGDEMRDGEARRTQGAAARAVAAERHGVERMVRETAALYRRVLR